jgi:hypothetical protein
LLPPDPVPVESAKRAPRPNDVAGVETVSGVPKPVEIADVEDPGDWLHVEIDETPEASPSAEVSEAGEADKSATGQESPESVTKASPEQVEVAMLPNSGKPSMGAMDAWWAAAGVHATPPPTPPPRPAAPH